MKKTLLLLAACWPVFLLSAQETFVKPDYSFLPFEYLPDPSPEMPEWANLLYAEELNLFELEAAVDAYLQAPGAQQAAHRPWMKYYQLLDRNAWPYLDGSGQIQRFNQQENLAQWSQQQMQARQPQAGNWNHVGPKLTYWRAEHRTNQVAPWQTNVYSFAIAASNPNVLYAGSETGGLFKTTDKGLNWTLIAQQFRFGSSIREVAVAPSNENVVILSSGNGLFLSEDGGLNWELKLSLSGLNCDHLSFHPTNPDIILAATGAGVYRTTNGGDNWSSALFGKRVYTVDFKTDDPTTIFALCRNSSNDEYEFHRSSNSGASYTQITNGWINGINEGSGARMCVTPANSNYIYVVALSTAGPRIVRSTDAGLSWSLVASGSTPQLGMDNGQGFYDLDIMASPNNANHIIVATTTAYKSTDGGVNYNIIGGYGGSFDIHPDMQRMRAFGNDAWIATDGGMNYSSDFFTNTSNFEARINGLIGTEFWGYHQGWNQDVMVGGRYHNGNTFFGEMFPPGQALRMGGAESATGWVMHHRPMHSAYSDLGDGIVLSSVFDQPAVGRFPFTVHPTEGSRGYNASVVLTDPRYFEHYYVGNGSFLYRSTDGGGAFSVLHDFGATVRKMAISWDDPGVLFVFTDGGFWTTDDGGGSWSSVSLPAGFSPGSRSALCLDPSDSERLWILNPTGSNLNKVYRSDNGGSSWVNITTSSLNNRNFINIAHGGNNDDDIYLSSWGGVGNYGPTKVFYRGNSDSDWTDYSDGLPDAFNPLKTIPFYRDGKLKIAGNRGVYETPLVDPSFSPIIRPTANRQLIRCSRDTVQFDDYSILNHANASWSWSFPGATYVSATNVRNPKVLYSADGTYTATLTVTQGSFTDSKTVEVTLESACEPEEIPDLAMDLAGSSTDYATIPATGETITELTVTAWIKPSGDQAAWAGIVFMRNPTWGLNFRNNNELGYHWDGAGSYSFGTGHFVSPDEWHHVALVVTPSSATLYLDGEPATRNASHSARTFTNSIRLGRDPNFGSRFFKGLMDEVTIWNRALSTDEIRLGRHLTKDPAADPSIIHYYQFNELDGEVLDRASIAHASLAGSAGRSTSTAPFGGGVAQLEAVNSGGIFDFINPELSLRFPETGPYPNGDLVVTRIRGTNPDQQPGDNQVQNLGYWIVNNYGSNSNFNGLENLRFSGLSGINTGDPTVFHLYKRPSNAYADSWGDVQDFADAATFNSLTFSTDNGVTAFSQFTIEQGAALPVELLSFRAMVATNGKDVDFRWSTAREINNAYFVLERSRDGQQFNDIGRVNTLNGNSNSIQQYTYRDVDPGRGQWYYRLRQVDVDESFAYSSIEQVSLRLLAEDITVFPNLLSANETLQLRTDLSNSYRFLIYDGRGRRVFDQQLSGDQSLSLDFLQAGAYIYQLRYGNQLRNGSLIIQ